ncbi:MAG: PAS domain S-box protein [Gallionella sp.]|jgi:PAS domain S-box-containing protein
MLKKDPHKIHFLLHRSLSIALLFLLSYSLPAWSLEQPHVLLLNSYHQGMDWTDGETAGVREVLNQSGRLVDLHVEYMDTKRLNDETHFENLRQMLAYKYRNTQFSAVLATDNDAFNFLRRHRDALFGPVPVVFTGVNFYRDEMLDGLTGYTGVAETFEGGQTLAMMSKLHPKAKRVVVIIDATTTGKAVRKELEPMLSPYVSDLAFEFWDDLSLAQLPDRLAGLEKDSLVLLMPYARDSAGSYITYPDIATLVSRYSRVPVYATWDFYMGYGIVGGRLTNATAQGRAAANILLRVLAGDDVGHIPVTRVAPSEFEFDVRELERHGIAYSALPEGSRLLFQSWYQNNWIWVWLGGLSGMVTLILVWGWARSYRLEHRSDSALRVSEERLRLALDAANQGWFDLNVQTGELTVSPEYAKMLGYNPEDFHSDLDNWKNSLHPDDRDKVLEVFRECLKTCEPRTMQYRRKNAGGDWVWISSVGKVTEWDAQHRPLRMVGVHTDITENKRAEDELRDNRTFLDNVIENIPAMIFVKDARDLRFARFNKAGEKLLGFSRDELIGKNDYDFFPKPEADFFTAKDRDVLISGVMIDIPEESIRTKDLGVRLLHTKKIPLLDKEGKPEYLVGISEDITERRQTEEMLRQNEEQMRSQLDELRRWQNVMMEREDRILDLKREVNELLARLDEHPRYGSAAEGENKP